MEIFQTIWTALTTQNEVALNVIGFISCIVEAIVNMLLFTTVLNIKASTKPKIIYVIFIVLVSFISRNFIPNPYATFLNLTFAFILVKVFLKTNILKSLMAVFIPIVVCSILELVIFQLYLSIFKVSHDDVITIPLHRALSSFIIYLCVYIVYKIISYFKFKINLENMTTKNKILFILNILLGIITIGTQIYLIAFYTDMTPIVITVISIVTLIAYFLLSIYNIFSTAKLETTSQNLEEAQLYNKTLILLHDSMRGFKHDFNNIVQGIGGYINTNDIEGLKKYYTQLLKDCNRVNNLTALNPNVVNNPVVYNIMAAKYHKADEIGVEINLGVFLDLNEIEKHMKIYEFTRILGILMDNAIEAADECEEKIVHVSFRKEEKRKRIVMVIENTYKIKDINLDHIFEKDFSTKSKKTNSGLGLWEVRQILKKNNNLNLYTTKNDEFFVQQFEIYY